MTEAAEVYGQEPLSQQVSRRLRGALAENRISQTALAAAMHVPQQKLSRKLTGMTPFTLDELQALASVLGISLERVMGTGAYEGRPIGLCAIRDSNPEPAGLEPLRLVTPLSPPRGRRHLRLVRDGAAA